VNIAASSLSSVFVMLVTGGSDNTWMSTALITVLVIIFGETMPKITAKKNANNLALKNSGLVTFLMIVLSPLVKLVVFLVNLLTSGMKGEERDDDEAVEELQSTIEAAEDEGVLDEDRSDLVQAAIDFTDIAAYEVMTARVDVESIDIDDPLEKVYEIVENSHFSRIPVYQDSIDNIVGVLSVNRFLKAASEDWNVDIHGQLMEPCYVYKTMKLPDCLNALRREKQHLAIVSDEYGGTLGVLSMEDILEQIVGDIWDETDTVEEEVVKVDDNEYELDGDMLISDFLELAGIPEREFEAESETVGGWTVEMFGDFPEEGDSFDFRNFTVKVLEMDGRRVEKVLVTKHPEETEEKEESPEK